VNVSAPQPARIKDFCATLGGALGRPSWAPVPGFVLRIGLGELAGMVLGGQRAVPSALLAAGYRFKHPELREALLDALHESP
jgi:NAD dependent epimerase/dehydratase family enzyme